MIRLVIALATCAACALSAAPAGVTFTDVTKSAGMHFLARRFDAALQTLERVQDVDPEDLQMHYTAMLCYRALGKADLANREEALFLRFKADESSQAITQSRRMISPEDNNERQLIHDHESVRLSSQQ